MEAALYQSPNTRNKFAPVGLEPSLKKKKKGNLEMQC